jgi:hypothetical protein
MISSNDLHFRYKNLRQPILSAGMYNEIMYAGNNPNIVEIVKLIGNDNNIFFVIQNIEYDIIEVFIREKKPIVGLKLDNNSKITISFNNKIYYVQLYWRWGHTNNCKYAGWFQAPNNNKTIHKRNHLRIIYRNAMSRYLNHDICKANYIFKELYYMYSEDMLQFLLKIDIDKESAIKIIELFKNIRTNELY